MLDEDDQKFQKQKRGANLPASRKEQVRQDRSKKLLRKPNATSATEVAAAKQDGLQSPPRVVLPLSKIPRVPGFAG